MSAATKSQSQRIAFRFGLTGRRWGEAGPVVLLLFGRESAPAWLIGLVGSLLAHGAQVISLDDPTELTSSRTSRVAEYAAAINEAAVEIDGISAVVAQGLGASAASLAIEQGLHVNQATLLA